MRFYKLFSFLVYISICLITPLCTAKSQHKYYEPAQEEVIGTIKKLTFPGPPNYEDVNKGDIGETCPYLILDKPINVTTKEEDTCAFCADENQVQLIQLAVNKKSQWRLMKDGSRLKIKGKLYPAHTGHHHTRVLMMVDQVQVEIRKPSLAVKQMRIQCGSNHGFCEVVN